MCFSSLFINSSASNFFYKLIIINSTLSLCLIMSSNFSFFKMCFFSNTNTTSDFSSFSISFILNVNTTTNIKSNISMNTFVIYFNIKFTFCLYTHINFSYRSINICFSSCFTTYTSFKTFFLIDTKMSSSFSTCFRTSFNHSFPINFKITTCFIFSSKFPTHRTTISSSFHI